MDVNIVIYLQPKFPYNSKASSPQRAFLLFGLRKPTYSFIHVTNSRQTNILVLLSEEKLNVPALSSESSTRKDHICYLKD